MSKINIDGQSYKVRQREVDGKKQEIYYNSGQAYIKTSDGKLEKLNKFSDGIFNKASYTTQAFENKTRENFADSLNSKYTDENRPMLQGKVDANTFIHSTELVGYKGKFSAGNDRSINGVIIRDKETNENRVLAERNNSNGTSASAIYAMNEETGELFLESRTMKNPDGSGLVRKFNYETGKYDLTKIEAPKTETPETAPDDENKTYTGGRLTEVVVTGKAPKQKGVPAPDDENKTYTGGRLAEVVVTGKAPKQKGVPENENKSNGFEISTNFADYPKGKEALKKAVNISGMNSEQLADIKDGTAVKIIYTGKDGKPKVIAGIMAGGNFTAPVDRTPDGKCYVGVFDPSKLMKGNNQIDLQNSKIKTLEPKDELLANND